jgi:hypothetical protein
MTNPPREDDRDPGAAQQPGEWAPPPGWGPPPSAPAQPDTQDPYGQSSSGPPPDQSEPARRSRAAAIAAVAGAVVLLVVGGIVLAFALRSEVLDPRAVERDVAAQFQQREGVGIDLECTDGMKVESGASYECTGVTADEEPVTLRITITDPETAAYTWTEP